MKSWNEILTRLWGLKKELALELADSSAKSDVSRRLTELSWRETILDAQFCQPRRTSAATFLRLDYSWNKLMDCPQLNGLPTIWYFSMRSRSITQDPVRLVNWRKLSTSFLTWKTLWWRSRKSSSKDEATALKPRIDQLNETLYFLCSEQAFIECRRRPNKRLLEPIRLALLIALNRGETESPFSLREGPISLGSETGVPILPRTTACAITSPWSVGSSLTRAGGSPRIELFTNRAAHIGHLSEFQRVHAPVELISSRN